MPPSPGPFALPAEHDAIEAGLVSVRESLSGLRFGTVLLTVHDGRIVQIDVTEKRRLTPT